MTIHAAEIFVQVYATLLVAIMFGIRVKPIPGIVVGPLWSSVLLLPLAAIGLLLFRIGTGSKPDLIDVVFAVLGGVGLVVGFVWAIIQFNDPSRNLKNRS